SAGNGGGGLAGLGDVPVILASTIVAGNTSSGAPDVSFLAATKVAGNSNLIGVANVGNATYTGTGNLTGTQATPLSPGLLPLGNFGGPTRTCALMPTSTAIDKGSNPKSFATDQRGTIFTRVNGSAADIGAYEYNAATPAKIASISINAGSVQR